MKNLSILRQRCEIVRALRRFFESHDFLEVEAPLIVSSPGMELHLDAFELKGIEGPRRYLHTSPEYGLKRLLGGERGAGLERVFSLCPCFRDEPAGPTHSPEFTMLEWYEVGRDLDGLMDQTEALLKAAAQAVGRTLPDFERLSVRAAFQRHANLDPWSWRSADALRTAGRMAGVAVPTDSSEWDDVFFQIFLNAVEPKLGGARPTFLYGYPASQAALARLDPNDARTALRFELFAGGQELANAFDELTAPDELRARFKEEQSWRRAAGRTVYPIDEHLLTALPNMAQTSGIALGVDRLVMWLTGTDDIADVRPQAW